MRQRLGAVEKAALFIAALLIVGGAFGALAPRDFILAHGTWGGQARGGTPATLIEHVTVAHARFYGFASVVGGAVLAGYVLWAARSE